MAAKPYLIALCALALAAVPPTAAAAQADRPEWTPLPEPDPNFALPLEPEVRERRPVRGRARPAKLFGEEAEAYEAGLKAGQAAKEAEEAAARAERAICKTLKEAQLPGEELPPLAAHCR